MILGMVAIGGLGEAGGGPLGADPVDDPAFSPGLSSAVSNLPEYSGPTEGVGETGGSITRVSSGNRKADAQWINTATNRLRAAGVWPFPAISGRASDVEQKFAAMMPQQGATGKLVINNPNGPCDVLYGCNQSLDAILGSSSLEVYWPRSGGGWWMKTYGGS
jgi:SCP1.201-like deaminase